MLFDLFDSASLSSPGVAFVPQIAQGKVTQDLNAAEHRSLGCSLPLSPL